MECSKKRSLNNSFSHIYVEKDAFSYDTTINILNKFKNSTVINITDYKSIFSRTNQNFSIQKKSMSLILAVKKDNFLYKGAKVCESFGNANFFYTTSVINCVFDCEYCFLQGVYDSANIVIFVNLEDTFAALETLLETDDVYLCISYDSDLLALENITNFISKWYSFAERHPGLKIELRTKSNNIKYFLDKTPNKYFILAWTLSPQEIIASYEHGTPDLKERVQAIKKVQDMGYSVRLCFDPMIYVDDFYNIYRDMIKYVFSIIDPNRLLDVSIGTFRISKEYLKRMRKNREDSLILYYPFTCDDGVYSYPGDISKKTIEYLKNEVSAYVSSDKIYI